MFDCMFKAPGFVPYFSKKFSFYLGTKSPKKNESVPKMILKGNSSVSSLVRCTL